MRKKYFGKTSTFILFGECLNIVTEKQDKSTD